MSNPGQASAGGGQPGVSYTPIPPPTPGVGMTVPAATTSTVTVPPSNQNLNQIVTDYLLKRGYKTTEAAFRKEIASGEAKAEEQENKRLKPEKYVKAYEHFEKWVDSSLDLYKFELGKVLWPIFVYSFIDLVKLDYKAQARSFMQRFKERFENVRADEVNSLKLVQTPTQLEENSIARLYLKNKYHIPLNKFSSGNLFNFLERDSSECGEIVTYLLSTFCQLDTLERGPIDPYSFEAIHRRARNLELDEIDAQEGIPGIPSTGSITLNKEILDNNNAAALKLGLLPLDSELRKEVLEELEDEDRLNPPSEGTRSLVDEFNIMHPIKKEVEDSPSRTEIPYPPARARDIVMEMQKVRENRDRFKIEGRTGGVNAGVSICMYTIHNAANSVSSMDFSKDLTMMAVGTTESYIRVWSLDESPLKSSLPGDENRPANSRKLIGHSGSVTCVQFSDAIKNLNHNIYDGEAAPETDSKLLISCSQDGHVRLWSLETWSCLCVYKGHDGPISKMAWGPHGHYFLTGGRDTVARIWAQDRTSAVRMLVGHDTPISAVCWHPNGAYVFSVSDESDKTIRMWSVVSGKCTRMFHGHTDYVSAMQCSPNGKVLASADIGGNICIWDLDSGKRVKRMRGHGRGGIWSISFNVESNTLVSGGADNTVRVWDVEMPAEGTRTAAQGDGADGTIVAAGGTGSDAKTSAQGAAGGAGPSSGGSKKKGKEVTVTPDQISAFPTKRTPVRKVMFSRMNLVIAGGCYEQER